MASSLDSVEREVYRYRLLKNGFLPFFFLLWSVGALYANFRDGPDRNPWPDHPVSPAVIRQDFWLGLVIGSLVFALAVRLCLGWLNERVEIESDGRLTWFDWLARPRIRTSLSEVRSIQVGRSVMRPNRPLFAMPYEKIRVKTDGGEVSVVGTIAGYETLKSTLQEAWRRNTERPVSRWLD